MIRSTARTMLRRRLNERAAENWTDAELNELLNAALTLVQKFIIKVDAYAFMSLSIHNTVAGSAGEFYDAPPGMWYEFEVGLKTSAGQSTYTRLARGNYHDIREAASGSSTTPRYARHGAYFAIWPNPTVAVTGGLQVQFMPTLFLVDDTTTLPIHPALHMAVVAWATMIAVGETMESTTELTKELAGYLSDIPEFYHRGGDPSAVRLSVNKTVY